MKTGAKVLLVLLAVGFGIGRLFVPPSTPGIVDVYKDFVHVYMGVLGTLWWQGDKLCTWLFWGLSALEIFMAVVSRL